MKTELTAERLRELLRYNPETGVFTWRVAPGNGTKSGAPTGYAGKDGYLRIKIAGRLYAAHRMAWFYTHGVWPSDQIDHRDGVRGNNRLANLREATNEQNCQNQPVRRTNTSGYPGVSWHKKTGRWVAAIGANGRKTSLGYYVDPAQAHAAYVSAKAKFHHFNPVVRCASDAH